MKNLLVTKRVFLGIKMTEDVVTRCKTIQRALRDLPVRFVAPENIHLTLVPPWNMEDQALVEEKLAIVASQIHHFPLNLVHLTTWPMDRRRYPRLVWIECTPIKALCLLRNALLESFSKETLERDFLPHITIARFNRKQTRQHYVVEQAVCLSMQVESFQLFEVPKAGGAYQILKTFFIR